MIAFFRLKFVAFLLGGALFFGFGLKASVEISGKFSCFLQCLEDDQQLEKEKSDNDEKQTRKAKKNWDVQALEFGQVFSRNPIAWGAAERAYLMATLLEPLIAIPIQPPKIS